MSNIDLPTPPHKRGGARKGAGRPNELDRPVKFLMMMEASTLEAIDEARGDQSRSEWVRRAVTGTLADRKP